MKIAILGTKYSPPFFRGGEEHVIFNLVKYLSKRNYSTEVFAPKFRKWRKLDSTSTATNVCRIPVSNIRFFYHFQFARSLARCLKADETDIVLNTHTALGHNLSFHPHIIVVATTNLGEANSASRSGLLGLLEGLIRRKFAYRIEKRAFQECDHIVCVSDHIMDDLSVNYGIQQEKMSVIGNGVDCTYFSPSVPRERTPDEQFHILYVGRLVNRKNVELLVRAAGHLKSNGGRISVRIAGDGPERSALERLSKDSGLEDMIQFHGICSGNELLNLYRSSDLFVLPSTYEGMPLVLLEAMSCGLPSIVNAFAGAEKVVTEGLNGYILREGTPEELARMILRIHDDSELLISMGGNARRLVLEKYSWDRIVDQYCTLFSSLCDPR